MKGKGKMGEKFRPVTAITMGDPAGIGPEIVTGTMLSKEIQIGRASGRERVFSHV